MDFCMSCEVKRPISFFWMRFSCSNTNKTPFSCSYWFLASFHFCQKRYLGWFFLTLLRPVLWMSDLLHFMRRLSFPHWVFLEHLSKISWLMDLLFSANFGLRFSSFSSTLRCKVKLLIWDLSSFLMLEFINKNFPLRIAFATFHKFWYMVFSF